MGAALPWVEPARRLLSLAPLGPPLAGRLIPFPRKQRRTSPFDFGHGCLSFSPSHGRGASRLPSTPRPACAPGERARFDALLTAHRYICTPPPSSACPALAPRSGHRPFHRPTNLDPDMKAPWPTGDANELASASGACEKKRSMACSESGWPWGNFPGISPGHADICFVSQRQKQNGDQTRQDCKAGVAASH